MERWSVPKNALNARTLKSSIGNFETASVLFVDLVVIEPHGQIYSRREPDLKHRGIKGCTAMICPGTANPESGDICGLLCPFLSIGLLNDGVALVLTCRANPRIIVAESFEDQRERIVPANDNVRKIEMPIPKGETET